MVLDNDEYLDMGYASQIKRVNENSNLKENNHCLNCKTELPPNRKFCNAKCQNDFEYNQYIQRWQNGLETGMKGKTGISARIRKFLFKKNNSSCSICGWSKINPYTGTIPLEVHHLDGNYLNNKESNLELLCPCCHSLTPTYKSLNTGSGREGRRGSYLNSRGNEEDENIGQTFGIYTIVEATAQKNKSGSVLYKGICKECGFEKYDTISNFRCKQTANCRHVKHCEPNRVRNNHSYLLEMPAYDFEGWYSLNKKQCLHCKKDIPVSATDSKKGYLNKNFCSNQCYVDYEYNRYISRWKDGLENGMKGLTKISDRIKRYLLEKAEYKCPVCGWCEVNPYTGKIPLEIHHIDGDYTNNVEGNLVVLCPNCHSLTPNYKSANNGRGRGNKNDNSDMGD